MSLAITFQFGLTVPQQIMFFICKSSNKLGGEKETVPPEFVSKLRILVEYPDKVV
jgi:hypothetical protein